MNSVDDIELINKIKEIDEKLHKDISGKERTRLMYEQLLKGLQISQAPMGVIGGRFY